jgi:hypothetical protein
MFIKASSREVRYNYRSPYSYPSRKPNEILHNSTSILLRHRSARKIDVHVHHGSVQQDSLADELVNDSKRLTYLLLDKELGPAQSRVGEKEKEQRQPAADPAGIPFLSPGFVSLETRKFTSTGITLGC